MSVSLGHMVLYDRVDPPLTPGRYRVRVDTTVAVPGATLQGDVRYFDVEGPRFSLAPTEVAGVFPPSNGHGHFFESIPHLTLARRTLPWERALDPRGRLPPPPPRTADDPPAPAGAPPWMALLLLEDVEARAILKDVPVTDVLPPGILTDLAAPPDARCDAVEIDASLAQALLPTVEEMQLLAHAREVNVDDRELSAGDSDGWFAVVMANRIPAPGKKYRACLVSLEGRADLLSVTPPPVAVDPLPTPLPPPVVAPPVVAPPETRAHGPIVDRFEAAAIGERYLPPFVIFLPPVRLVLLHSWNFECEGVASFEELAIGLDVGMIGAVRGEFPVVTDTGHVAIDLRDRAGAAQKVWYRGPLVPFPITRDEHGPYHTADQCRRVSPETGMEDVSYAAAFEAGRLLAASDARLAQELMRWRRVDYRRSLDNSLHDAIRVRFPSVVDPTERIAGVTAQLAPRWLDAKVPSIDPFERATIETAPGLQPARIAEAWGISTGQADRLLARQLGVLGSPIERLEPAPSGPVTLDSVKSDEEGLSRLVRVHTAAIAFDARNLARGGGER